MRYPKGVIKDNSTNNTIINYGNRGMNLENEINLSNKYYLDNNIAFIYKKPTPIKIVKVDYSNNSAIIKEAFFESPSTTDYNGLYKKIYIDFEAKETNNKTSFPLNNIHAHQIKHIMNITRNGGICFLIVRFNKLNQTFLLMADDFIRYINENDKSSIPIDFFLEFGHIIEDKYIPRVDYLKIVDTIIGGVCNG